MIDTSFKIQRAEILSVGTELLIGQVVDTNAFFLSGQLAELGISTFRHTVVGDNRERLEAAMRQAIACNDLLITTGGLGPTSDDVTASVTAALAGVSLAEDPAVMEDLRRRFPGLDFKGYPLLPQGSLVFRNDQGTAPGSLTWLSLEGEKKAILMLPGPPDEMEPMFVAHVRPSLEAYCPYRFIHRYVRLQGLGESKLEERILDLIQAQDQVTLAPYASLRELVVRLSQRLSGPDDRDLTLPLVEELQRRLADYIFEIGPRHLEEVLYDLLLERNLQVAFAESCTAGLTASTLASVAGASSVLTGGFVVYNNRMKEKLLGLDPDLLSREGAVSSATALAMAAACRKITDAGIAVSVTGFAGPGGGTPKAPVGTVFIACDSAWKEPLVQAFHFSGDRERVRIRSAYAALNLLRRYVLDL